MEDTIDGRIPLHVSNKTAFVWSVEDVATLRATHHVCGVLTGTLPHASQQNVFLGLPLELLPEEVVLLVKQGIAYIVDDNASHATPTTEQLVQWNEKRRQALAKLPARSSSSLPPTLNDEALKKRLERQQKKEAQLLAKEESLVTPDQPKPPASSSKEQSYSFTIPATSDFSWYNAKTYITLDEARTSGVWSYPHTPEEVARCRVFEDLWKQGYFMGNGLRFGGHWLVYPGDPLRFHSHFVATVIPSPVMTIHPIEIIAFGRLGTATKKSHLLCGWDEEKQETSYYSIEWAGFG
ncbi:hypothetical protein M408DRAFT_16000 [Serendipita vermifera MAFF 305830]|uniref:tRNA-splicing endonuclease subunit Sen34 n=1 Tax=Serendipita vermifera MAFF 305830 TaxID=933852 RepID=A0A0C2XIQ3_SERVB|nr:hypothetical protein M408DRAFT_16000 [Serendipita vermifera MAFF 305830]